MYFSSKEKRYFKEEACEYWKIHEENIGLTWINDRTELVWVNNFTYETLPVGDRGAY
jgi:hypothetical protein